MIFRVPSLEDIGDHVFCDGLELDDENFHHSHEDIPRLRKEGGRREGGRERGREGGREEKKSKQNAKQQITYTYADAYKFFRLPSIHTLLMIERLLTLAV